MRLIIKGRGQGKTAELIYTSEVTGYPIIAHSEKQRDYIKEMAKKMNCIIPNPYTVQELTSQTFRHGRRLDEQKMLLDDAELIIGAVINNYLGTDVVSATLTDQLKEWVKYLSDSAMVD